MGRERGMERRAAAAPAGSAALHVTGPRGRRRGGLSPVIETEEGREFGRIEGQNFVVTLH